MLVDKKYLDDDYTNENDESENEDIEIKYNDSDDDINIVIEIDDNIDIVMDIDEGDIDTELSEIDTLDLSKHKMEGKHSLNYDTIFKGKKESFTEEDIFDSGSVYTKDIIELDRASSYHQESINNDDYIREKKVKERVYYVLKTYTDLNFSNNRRKPSRVDFNKYFSLLRYHLKFDNFTNIEIFNELSFYFSDNLFNMFKLLDNKWRNLLMDELEEHVGKRQKSKDINNRNITVGTELEFKWENEFGELKMITGVVIETDYENSEFKIDSYENIYDIYLSDVTKIINNTKFKYNLNKLNNIDFL